MASYCGDNEFYSPNKIQRVQQADQFPEQISESCNVRSFDFALIPDGDLLSCDKKSSSNYGILIICQINLLFKIIYKLN